PERQARRRLRQLIVETCPDAVVLPSHTNLDSLCGPGCEAVSRLLWRNTVEPGKGLRLTVRYDEAHDDPQGAGRNLGGSLDEILDSTLHSCLRCPQRDANETRAGTCGGK